MLTFTSIGTSVSTTDIWALEFRYANVCTNFDHTSGATFFGGNARINGGTAYGVSGSTSQSLGTAPSLVLGVSDSSFDTIGTVAYWIMTMSPIANPYSAFSHSASALTALAASMIASLTFTDVNGGFGQVAGYLGNQSGPITFGFEGLNLTRGGSCPV